MASLADLGPAKSEGVCNDLARLCSELTSERRKLKGRGFLCGGRVLEVGLAGVPPGELRAKGLLELLVALKKYKFCEFLNLAGTGNVLRDDAACFEALLDLIVSTPLRAINLGETWLTAAQWDAVSAAIAKSQLSYMYAPEDTNQMPSLRRQTAMNKQRQERPASVKDDLMDACRRNRVILASLCLLDDNFKRHVHHCWWNPTVHLSRLDPDHHQRALEKRLRVASLAEGLAAKVRRLTDTWTLFELAKKEHDHDVSQALLAMGPIKPLSPWGESDGEAAEVSALRRRLRHLKNRPTPPPQVVDGLAIDSETPPMTLPKPATCTCKPPCVRGRSS